MLTNCEKLVSKVAVNFIENGNNLKAVLDSKNITYLQVLQPLRFSELNRYESNQFKCILNYYKILEKEFINSNWRYTSQQYFNDEKLFEDEVHFNYLGHQKMASYLKKLILKN